MGQSINIWVVHLQGGFGHFLILTIGSQYALVHRYELVALLNYRGWQRICWWGLWPVRACFDDFPGFRPIQQNELHIRCECPDLGFNRDGCSSLEGLLGFLHLGFGVFPIPPDIYRICKFIIVIVCLFLNLYWLLYFVDVQELRLLLADLRPHVQWFLSQPYSYVSFLSFSVSTGCLFQSWHKPHQEKRWPLAPLSGTCFPSHECLCERTHCRPSWWCWLFIVLSHSATVLPSMSHVPILLIHKGSLKVF